MVRRIKNLISYIPSVKSDKMGRREAGIKYINLEINSI